MIIAQISDTHISVDHEDGPARAENLKAVIGALHALDPAPDLVIHTGDLVNRGKEEEYDLATTLLAPLRIPFYPIPGNRDHRGLMAGALKRIGCDLPGNGFLHYDIEGFPVRLIGLDSQSSLNNKGAFCQDRRAWLQNTLEQEKERPTALFMHHPPFDIVEAKDPFQFNEREDAQKLEEIIAANPQIIRLFCGHAHRSAHTSFGNRPATTIPSVATSLQKGTQDRMDDRRPPIYLHTYCTEQRAFTTVQHCVK